MCGMYPCLYYIGFRASFYIYLFLFFFKSFQHGVIGCGPRIATARYELLWVITPMSPAWPGTPTVIMFSQVSGHFTQHYQKYVFACICIGHFYIKKITCKYIYIYIL